MLSRSCLGNMTKEAPGHMQCVRLNERITRRVFVFWTGWFVQL